MKHSEKKILIVITLFSIGGATETVISLASGFKKRGFHVDIVTGPPLPNEGNMFTEAKNAGLSVIVLKELIRDIHPLYDFRALKFLITLIKKNNYSIVHTHSSKAGVLGRVAAWITNVPVIIHTIHGLPYHDYQHKVLTLSYILMEKLCALISSKIVSVTHAIVKNCVKNKIAPFDKFVVIRSGFSMNNYKINNELRSQIRKRYGFIDTDIVAGIISRIAPLKGHEFIIDLATKTQHVLPHLRFLLVGDGELASNLKNEVISRHLSQNVFFCGMVAPDEIPKMINAMDFVIHPSLREGLARVLPQSIIMNRRVLTFNLDGVEEVIVNGVSGYKIEIGNVDALFEQCIKLCQEEIGKNIDERFRQSLVYEFDSSTMVEQHVNLYSSFLHS